MAVVKARNLLLPSKEAEVVERVYLAGFSKADFDFRKLDASTIVTMLLYLRNTDFRFVFFPAERWGVSYSPAENTWSSGRVRVGPWETVLVLIDDWLRYINREMNITDPWAAFAESAEPVRLASDGIDNEDFSPAEQAVILARIEQVRVYLLDAEVRSEQDRHIIMERLDYLSAAVSRLGRFDWRGVAVNVVLELGMLGYVEGANVRHVVEFIVGTVQRLLPG